MNRETVRTRIEQIGIVPAIRLSSSDDALFAAEAVAECGIPIAEVTMTVPGAVDVIRKLASDHSELIVGAGTVMDLETLQRCLDAGARFVTSTGFDAQIVEFALKHGVVTFPGALTPSEVMAARKVGSDFVKVFPCSLLGGPTYIKALKSPFPDARLIAAGGVNQQNTADFLLAGAVAVGVGRELISPEAVRRRQLDWIRELAHRFLQIVRDARSRQGM
jgi:2-dehydro-3-deoxyphosphogluconate aldolase / (4S)-4-hydroxy-2-oxoglutarate aldolase